MKMSTYFIIPFFFICVNAVIYNVFNMFFQIAFPFLHIVNKTVDYLISFSLRLYNDRNLLKAGHKLNSKR